MGSATSYGLRGMLCWVLLLTALSTVDALTCYRCQHSGPTENPCVFDPAQVVGQKDEPCTGQCYLTRQVTTLNHQLHSVYRGCDKDNTKTEVEDEDIGGMLTRTHVCTTDHCNDQNLTYVPPPTEPPVTGPTTTPNPARFSCYSCTYAYGGPTDCIDSPENVRTVFCEPPNYCSLVRQYLVLEKRVNSFQRGCRARNNEKNGCVLDSQFNTCLTLCPTNLCNTGDGSNPPPDPTVNPGGAPALLGSTILLILTSISALMFTMKY